MIYCELRCLAYLAELVTSSPHAKFAGAMGKGKLEQGPGQACQAEQASSPHLNTGFLLRHRDQSPQHLPLTLR